MLALNLSYIVKVPQTVTNCRSRINNLVDLLPCFFSVGIIYQSKMDVSGSDSGRTIPLIGRFVGEKQIENQ